jgi:hypothetical protein
LISSGIVQSKDRSPASTCAIGDPELRCRQRDGERRVDVATRAHQVGAPIEQHLLEGPQRTRGLRAVRARADAQEDVRLRQPQVREHLGRHPLVVVLAGVHHKLGDVVTPRERVDDRRHLHEVRARADDLNHLEHVLQPPSRPNPGPRDRSVKPSRTIAAWRSEAQDGCDVVTNSSRVR